MNNQPMTADDRDREMYGRTQADLHTFLVNHVGPGKTFETREKAAFSILSGAQEALNLNMVGCVRQEINRAKWLLMGGDRRRDSDPVAVDRRKEMRTVNLSIQSAAAELARQKEVWLAEQIDKMQLIPERVAELYQIEESQPRMEVDQKTGAHYLRMDLRLVPRG